MIILASILRLTIDKLEVAQRICPKIKKLDISMFNFSFDDQDEATAAELSKSSAMYFEFEVGLRCFEKEDMLTLHSRS